MAPKATSVRLLTVLALLAAPVMAQAPAAAPAKPLKIGVIDPELIIKNSTRGKAALERLGKEQDQRLSEGKRMRQEIEDLQKQLKDGQLSLGDAKLKQLNDALEDKTIALRRYGETYERDMQTLQKEVMDPIEDQILGIINQVGSEQGYTLIFKKFESGLVYADAAVDLTPIVVQRLESAPPPAPRPAAAPKPAASPAKPPGRQ